MGVNCRRLAELLIDYVNGELAEDARCHVEEHLCRCPSCVVYVETYRLTIHIPRKLAPAQIPEGLAVRLRQALEGECGQQWGERHA
jgi:anti-sigma factor RsiW